MTYPLSSIDTIITSVLYREYALRRPFTLWTQNYTGATYHDPFSDLHDIEDVGTFNDTEFWVFGHTYYVK